MASIILYDWKDPERSQVRFKTNYPGVKLYFASTVFDLFEYVEQLEKQDRIPSVIVLESETPKEEKGMIFGKRRVRAPFSIINFLQKKGHKFVIFTKGSKEKSFRELVKSYGRIHIEVLNKDCEKEEFRETFDSFFLDFHKAKIRQF